MKETTTHVIQNVLLDIGIPANLLGFMYLVYAIELALNDYEYIVRLYKLLYVDIAKKYKTDPGCVEHCVRSAIKKAFTSENNACLNQIFANEKYENTPSPTQFMSRMYFYIINEEYKKEATS